MGILDDIPHHSAASAHRPWPRVVATEEGWQAAIDQLTEGRLTLLGLWGEPAAVHMALLDAASAEIAVVSHECPSGSFPSVARCHPPALRLERAIHDLFGLTPTGAADLRPWLDHHVWGKSFPLSNRNAAREAIPYR